MSFNMMFGSAGAGLSDEELPALVATSFLEIVGRERSLANSLIIAGVSRGVSECGR